MNDDATLWTTSPDPAASFAAVTTSASTPQSSRGSLYDLHSASDGNTYTGADNYHDGQHATTRTVRGTIERKDKKIFDLSKKTLVTGKPTLSSTASFFDDLVDEPISTPILLPDNAKPAPASQTHTASSGHSDSVTRPAAAPPSNNIGGKQEIEDFAASNGPLDFGKTITSSNGAGDPSGNHGQQSNGPNMIHTLVSHSKSSKSSAPAPPLPTIVNGVQCDLTKEHTETEATGSPHIDAPELLSAREGRVWIAELKTKIMVDTNKTPRIQFAFNHGAINILGCTLRDDIFDEPKKTVDTKEVINLLRARME